MTANGVEFLPCPTCGAATPLLDSESVACAYCGARVAVPARVGAPIRQFRGELASFKQYAFEANKSPEDSMSAWFANTMAVVLAVFLVWWWVTFGQSSYLTDWPLLIVVGELVCLPICFILLCVVFASGERDYFRKAKLAFANLRFDAGGPGGVARAGLTCPRCAAPIDYQHTRDIVIRCSYCKTEVIIPSLMLGDQLQGMFRKLMAQRESAFDHYAARKWLLIGLVAFNGVFPVVILSTRQGDPAVESLLWLTAFSWSYMFAWLTGLWTFRAGDSKLVYGLVGAFLCMPLPVFFLLQVTGILLRQTAHA